MTIKVFYNDPNGPGLLSKSFIGEGKDLRSSEFENNCGQDYVRTERTGVSAPVVEEEDIPPSDG